MDIPVAKAMRSLLLDICLASLPAQLTLDGWSSAEIKSFETIDVVKACAELLSAE